MPSVGVDIEGGMIREDDLESLLGTVTKAKTRMQNGREVLRLQYPDGHIVAIDVENGVLDLADQTSIP